MKALNGFFYQRKSSFSFLAFYIYTNGLSASIQFYYIYVYVPIIYNAVSVVDVGVKHSDFLLKVKETRHAK